LEALIQTSAHHLRAFSEADAVRRLKRDFWTRAEALGHLLDWATTYHGWLARALTEPKLVAASYPLREWVSAQRYIEWDWGELVNLWIKMNRLLVHVISKIPENNLQTSCRIGLDPPLSLTRLITNYIERCEDMMSQILVRG